MRTFRIISGLLIDLLLFGALIPWATIHAGRAIDAAVPAFRNSAGPLFEILGMASIAAGTAWLVWAWALLVREGHGYMTELFGIEISPVTDRLVTGGPFSIHRHPVCVGYLAILAGIGLAIGSPGVAVVCVPLLLAAVFFYLRRFEEPALRRRLGHPYECYAMRVPMFIPRGRRRVPVAFRNLHADRVRFAISAAGVAFSVLLICFQLSILKGTSGQITTYIDHAGADLWAMQKGVDDFVATSAVLAGSVEILAGLAGIQKAAGIYAVYTLLEINGVKSRVYVIGYDTKSGDGGPWKLGRTLPGFKDGRSLGQNEVLLDENLARRHGLEPGARIPLFGRSFTIAGFTLETTSIGSQYVFLPRDAVRRIMPGAESAFTHVLLWTNGKIPAGDMVGKIEGATGLSALTREALAANMRGFLGTFMLPLLTAGVVMGFLVGSVTIGITLYTAVLEKFKEYGTMKALGATGWFLYGILLKQSMISWAVGTATGLILGASANLLINRWVPGMTAALDGPIAIETALAGLLMAVLSTGLPMWRLSRLDPMEAFRS